MSTSKCSGQFRSQRGVSGEMPMASRPKSITRRQQRVHRYLALVKPIAQFYASCSPEPVDDLLQVGVMGLLRAAELFNPEHKTPFEAFAKPHIRGSILHYLRDLAQPIRLPRRLIELKDRLNRHGMEVLSSQGLSQGDQRRLLAIQTWQRPISLDEAGEEGLAIQPVLEAETEIEGKDQQALALLSHLEPQLQIVIRKVVLAGWSYRQTASQLQVSPMTVQRRLKRGLGLLKLALDQPGTNQSGTTLEGLTPQSAAHHAAFVAPGCGWRH